MSEATGYHESPDTADSEVSATQVEGQPSSEQTEESSEVALVTDDEAQREDEVVRPGNAAG